MANIQIDTKLWKININSNKDIDKKSFINLSKSQINTK
jgi:hypothetical protein